MALKVKSANQVLKVIQVYKDLGAKLVLPVHVGKSDLSDPKVCVVNKEFQENKDPREKWVAQENLVALVHVVHVAHVAPLALVVPVALLDLVVPVFVLR